jgi:hypothetical protein
MLHEMKQNTIKTKHVTDICSGAKFFLKPRSHPEIPGAGRMT